MCSPCSVCNERAGDARTYRYRASGLLWAVWGAGGLDQGAPASRLLWDALPGGGLPGAARWWRRMSHPDCPVCLASSALGAHTRGCDRCLRGDARLGHPATGCAEANRLFSQLQLAQLHKWGRPEMATQAGRTRSAARKGSLAALGAKRSKRAILRGAKA